MNDQDKIQTYNMLEKARAIISEVERLPNHSRMFLAELAAARGKIDIAMRKAGWSPGQK